MKSPGCWVMVCGPSGAGKDSVIAWARAALAGEPRVLFARRLVTRAAHAESGHDEISPAALRSLHAGGGLAWHWEAHGCGYGIRSAYADEVASGRVVVVNGSRAHVQSLRERRDVRPVLVTAPAEVLQQRLHARGREGGAAVAERIARNAALAAPASERVIHNVGELAHAGDALRRYLQELLQCK